jgi:hypothetical protein
MTTKLFTILAVTAFAVMTISPAMALDWYVVQHKSGFTTIFDREPGPEWSIVSGPFATRDAAIRAAGSEIQPFNPFTVARPGGSGDVPAGRTGGTYYVVRHKSGATTVYDRDPGPEWTIASGPYGTWDEAARAGGVDAYDLSLRPSGPVDEPAGMRGEYFVVQHKSGATRVTDRAPMPGWRVVSGPYGGWDEAARAGGVDPYDYQKKLTP